MDQKHLILQHLIFKINQQLKNNIALIHYLTVNNNKDYYILLTTTDEEYAGKVYEIEQFEIDDYYIYQNIEFDYGDEVFFYFIDDLNESLLKTIKENQLKIDNDISNLIKKYYQKEWIVNYCNLNNNINLLDELE